MSLADQLKLLDQTVQDQQTSKYIDTVAVTALLYDILITIDREVDFVWKMHLTFGKILYFLVRYPVAIEGIMWFIYSVKLDSVIGFCKLETILGIWGSLIFLIPLQMLIALRTIALWSRNPVVIAILVTVAVAADTIVLVILSRITRGFSFTIDPTIRQLFGCSGAALHVEPSDSIPAWGAVIAFDTTIFILTLTKSLSSYKASQGRLLTILIRDGFMYYAVMLGIALINLCLLIGLPTSRIALASALTPFIRASFSIIGSRLTLNLRDAATNRSTTMSEGVLGQEVRLVDIRKGETKTNTTTTTTTSGTLSTIP